MSRALDLFRSLCDGSDSADLHALRDDVARHVDGLRKAQARSELIAVDLAEALGARLITLLQAAPSFEPAHRASVVGAARYFVSAEDARPDASSPTGLDDDVEVFNHVARSIGRSDLVIED